MPLQVEERLPEEQSLPPDPTAPTPVRAGQSADEYVDLLQRAIDGARLNAHFPPSEALKTHLGFLGPRGSCGVYDALRVAQNGLPAPREILRVKIDRDLAGEFLEDAARRNAPPDGSPLQRRIAYYSRLAVTQVMPLHRMVVELRRVVAAKQRAEFRITFDRFDLAQNQFVRYTILLAQHDRLWRKRQLVVDDRDLVAPTESFRRAVSRFASHDAELALILLSQVPQIEVEEVRRCRVGPLLLPERDPQDPLRAWLAGQRGGWVLCLPEERAGVGVTTHASADPLAPLMREAMSDPAAELIDAKAEQLDYRVAKARKFVCPLPLREGLETLLGSFGGRSVVHGV